MTDDRRCANGLVLWRFSCAVVGEEMLDEDPVGMLINIDCLNGLVCCGCSG